MTCIVENCWWLISLVLVSPSEWKLYFLVSSLTIFKVIVSKWQASMFGMEELQAVTLLHYIDIALNRWRVSWFWQCICFSMKSIGQEWCILIAEYKLMFHVWPGFVVQFGLNEQKGFAPNSPIACSERYDWYSEALIMLIIYACLAFFA